MTAFKFLGPLCVKWKACG